MATDHSDPVVLASERTILLTTFRRDGTPVGTPVNIALADEHAVFRTYSPSGKAKRIANNPCVSIAPSTMRGTPTGPAMDAIAHRISPDAEGNARRALGRNYPLIHSHLIPWFHKLRGYETIHYRLLPVPVESGEAKPDSA